MLEPGFPWTCGLACVSVSELSFLFFGLNERFRAYPKWLGIDTSYVSCIVWSFMERGGGAVFGEWGWIAIVVPHGHSRLRTSFLEMKFRKSSEVALYACCPCGDVFTL